jgi:3D (Asp-Asp-Asp) domain-containing protein
LLSITGFVWAQRQVSVVVDGRTLHIASQAADVAGLLSEAGVTVGEADLVFPTRDTKISAGLSVVVRHAVPVTVVLGDTKNEVKVVGKTVADALVAAGVDPASSAGVTPALDAPLSARMEISVPDCFSRVSAESTSIPFPVVRRSDGSLPKGKRRVVRKGSAGTRLRVYRTLVVSGVESSATLATERVVQPPVSEIVAVGTGDGTTAQQLAVAHVPARLMRASADGTPRGHEMRVVATAYSAAEPGSSSSTAIGTRCRKGVIAVDPHVIPLGTHVYVPGYGYAVAADTGGMINGRHIDLCYDSMSELEAWGRRVVTIIILD